MAPVVSLSGALAVAHGNQQAAACPAADQVCKQHADGKAHYGLNQICGNNGNTGIEYVYLAGFAFIAVAGFEGQGNKAQTEAVICERLKGDPLEEGMAGYFLYEAVYDQHKEACQHRAGDK